MAYFARHLGRPTPRDRKSVSKEGSIFTSYEPAIARSGSAAMDPHRRTFWPSSGGARFATKDLSSMFNAGPAAIEERSFAALRMTAKSGRCVESDWRQSRIVNRDPGRPSFLCQAYRMARVNAIPTSFRCWIGSPRVRRPTAPLGWRAATPRRSLRRDTTPS
jgi:hypothetical protein